MEKQMKQNQETITFNDLVTYYKKEIMEMRKNRDRAGLQEMQERLMKEAKEICKQNPVGFSAEQMEATRLLAALRSSMASTPCSER